MYRSEDTKTSMVLGNRKLVKDQFNVYGNGKGDDKVRKE